MYIQSHSRVILTRMARIIPYYEQNKEHAQFFPQAAQ